MRILLSWKKWEADVSHLIDVLEQNGHEVVYWVGYGKYFDYVKKISKTVCHDKDKANRNVGSDEVDITAIVPPSPGLIASLYDIESTILSMMNRRYGEACVNERKHDYYERVAYWDYVINQFKPDVVIFDDVPHSEYNFVIYGLAKLRGIHTIMFQKIRIADRWLLFNDWEHGPIGLSLQENQYSEHVKPKNISPEILEYFTLQANPRKDASISPEVYKKMQKGGLSEFFEVNYYRLRKIYTLVHRGGLIRGFLKRLITPHPTKVYRRLYQTEYMHYEREFDPSLPFVFFALHYQPERTTSPQGGVYIDQILAIETLSQSLPTGWVLYVKEHPRQWWQKESKGSIYSRYPKYYSHIARLPNVRIIPIDTDLGEDSYHLIEQARAVATITGTAGWEALLRRKPTFIFGSAWYQGCKGAFRIKDVPSCKTAFKEIKDSGFKITDNDLLYFLKRFDDIAIRGYVSGRSLSTLQGKAERRTEREGMDAMIRAICANIQATSSVTE